jgi:hypothetical protein
MAFESEEDRDYYVAKDPTHLAFIKDVAGLVEKVQVLDFMAGKF